MITVRLDFFNTKSEKMNTKEVQPDYIYIRSPEYAEDKLFTFSRIDPEKK